MHPIEILKSPTLATKLAVTIHTKFQTPKFQLLSSRFRHLDLCIKKKKKNFLNSFSLHFSSMAAPRNRSPSPNLARPNPNLRASETNSTMRRSFSGNPFARPSSLVTNPRSFNPTTPANSPAGSFFILFQFFNANTHSYVIIILYTRVCFAMRIW